MIFLFIYRVPTSPYRHYVRGGTKNSQYKGIRSKIHKNKNKKEPPPHLSEHNNASQNTFSYTQTIHNARRISQHRKK